MSPAALNGYLRQELARKDEALKLALDQAVKAGQMTMSGKGDSRGVLVLAGDDASIWLMKDNPGMQPLAAWLDEANREAYFAQRDGKAGGAGG